MAIYRFVDVAVVSLGVVGFREHSRCSLSVGRVDDEMRRLANLQDGEAVLEEVGCLNLGRCRLYAAAVQGDAARVDQSGGLA